MMFKRFKVGSKVSKITGSKKKILGAFVIVAFVAFFANVITRYIIVSDVDLFLAAFIVAFLIFAFLLVLDLQKIRKIRGMGARKRRR